MLRLEIKKLGQKIEAAIARRDADEPQAPYWIGLSRDEAAARLGQLREWVEHAARVQWPAYMAKVPQCWASHGEAVWELSNLMTEWHRIYGDEDSRDLQAALGYFERWLPGVLLRLGPPPSSATRRDAAGAVAVVATTLHLTGLEGSGRAFPPASGAFGVFAYRCA
jgi:hypothetical protein